MSVFNKKQVLDFLPHREPFLFVDSIEKITLPEEVELESLSYKNFKPLIGGRVLASFDVHEKLNCFQGHFPGKPIFPGVLQVEMMAQSCAFLMSACLQYQFHAYETEVAFLRIDQARFRKKVEPPMKLVTNSELLKVRADICQFQCQVSHGEEIVSEAEVMASLKFIKKAELN